MWICEFKPYPAYSNQKSIMRPPYHSVKTVKMGEFCNIRPPFTDKRKKPLNRVVKGFSLAPVTGLEPVAS